MFLIRSTFWLGLAFVVLQPQGWIDGAQAEVFGAKALEVGHQAVIQQIEGVACTSIECAGGKAVLLATGIKNNPSQASTMQESPSLKLAPVPRPRLTRAG